MEKEKLNANRKLQIHASSNGIMIAIHAGLDQIS